MGSFAAQRRCAAVILASAMVASAAAAAFVAGQRAAVAGAERALATAAVLEAWRGALLREGAKLRAERAAVESSTSSLAHGLAELQARLIRLDALGQRLAARAEFEGARLADFDFGMDPPLGGPEEAAEGASPRGVELTAAAGQFAAALEDRWLQFNVLDELVSRRKLAAELRPVGRPVSVGYVSSRFGRRIDPFTGQMAAHRGIDFAGPAGSEIVAVASGIVVWSGERQGYGRIVEIDHGRGHVTRYAHNSENLVQVGDVVTRGQPIARLGATGRATGPNLHFEVLLDGRPVNPLPYIECADLTTAACRS